MGQACECLKREELQHLWPALTLCDEGSTPSGCTKIKEMDIKLIILALETLQEQVREELSHGDRAPSARWHSNIAERIKREIELFKAEQIIAMFTNKTRE